LVSAFGIGSTITNFKEATIFFGQIKKIGEVKLAPRDTSFKQGTKAFAHGGFLYPV